MPPFMEGTDPKLREFLAYLYANRVKLAKLERLYFEFAVEAENGNELRAGEVIFGPARKMVDESMREVVRKPLKGRY